MDAAEYSMYATDITRTLPVNGHFTPRQKEIYDIVLGAQEAAVAAFQSASLCWPGILTTRSTRSRETTSGRMARTSTGSPDQYFIYGPGHYIGLNVHDPDDYKVPLAPGMAFTIEPGIYIPEENTGVRIEGDFFADADGKLIKLSCCASIESG